MALGEEKAEVAVETSPDTKVPSCGIWSCKEPEVDCPGPMGGEQLPRLEAEGGPASLSWGAEELSVHSCCGGADPLQAESASRQLAAGGSKPALAGLLLPPGLGTGDPLPSSGNQMEEPRTSASEELPQTLTLPRAAAPSSGHDADTEDDPSPAESPQMPDLSQQPGSSCFPFPSKWRSVVSPGAAAPQFSSCSISASSPSGGLQSHQERTEPQSCSLAKVSSELVVPQAAPSVVGSGPPLQWSPQPVSSRDGVPGQGRRHLSFQAEYWACVLPDSLPPSPDRHSPLWNPNKEYEDLLDYTYPLRPRPPLPKHLDGHVLADPVLQDSGVDLDSFSVSPASTIKSPTNVSRSCPPMAATALPVSAPRKLGLKRWPSRVPQKQGARDSASCVPLASTPRASGSGDPPWESGEPALRGMKDWVPMDEHVEVGSPQLRRWNGGWPSPRLGPERGARQGARPSACAESAWKSEEEMESDEEYLALPTRLTQVSSFVSYLGSFPTLVTLPSGAAEGQSSLDVSGSDGPASLPSDSSQSVSRNPEDQDPGLLNSFVPAGKGSLVSSRALGVSSAPRRTGSSLPAALDPQAFSEPDAGGQPPGREQGKDSLVQCVKVPVNALDLGRRLHADQNLKSDVVGVLAQLLIYETRSLASLGRWVDYMKSAPVKADKRWRNRILHGLERASRAFCCQLEELILWLYHVAAVTDHLPPPKSSLTGLKSSLQLYRQFKKDIDDHQSLTESVVQKGEILLQCLLDNTPVLKDVLGRISQQPSELESHADRLYDSILASLDLLAGCPLIPQHASGTQEH